MNSPPLVSMILLNYNGRQLLEKFCPSIAAQDYSRLEVIFVDNASQDDSIPWIESHYPSWKIIRNAVNEGTAGGWNMGAQHSRGDLIFWISTDMWFEPDCVSNLVKRFQDDPQMGICGCKVRCITPDLKKLANLDGYGNLLDFMGFPLPIGQDEEDSGQYDHIKDVFFVLSGAMMIRRNLFESTGGFDSEMFTMVEDIDLSWRIRLMGFKVCLEPRALLYHQRSATVSRIKRSQIRFWSERNTLRMLLKNYSMINLMWTLPCYCLVLWAEMIFYLVVRRWDIGARVWEAFVSNIRSMRTICRLRRQVQKTRKISDREIFRFIRLTSGKLKLGLDYLLDPHHAKWRNFFKTSPSKP